MASFGANGANAAVSNGAKRSNVPVSNRLGAIQLARHYPIGQHGANHAQGIVLNRSKNAHKHLVATR